MSKKPKPKETKQDTSKGQKMPMGWEKSKGGKKVGK